MNEENFFHFIHSLSRNERRGFTILEGGNNNNETKLYKLILSREKWNKETRGIIRAGKFGNTALYCNTRNRLITKIFKSLLYQEKGGYSYLDLIEKSIQKSLLTQSQKFINEAVNEYQVKSNLIALEFLYQSIDQWNERYAIDLEIPKDAPSFKEIELLRKNHKVLDSFIMEIKRKIKSHEVISEIETSLIKQSVKEIDSQENFTQFKKLNIAFLLSYGQGNYKDAIIEKERMVQQFRPEKGMGMVVYLKDLFMLVGLSCEIDDWERADKYFSLLQEQEGKTPIEKEKREYFWRRALVILSKHIGNLKFAEIAHHHIKSKPSRFSIKGIQRYKYLISCSFFLNEKWQESIELLNSIDPSPRVYLLQNIGEVLVMRAICLFEIDPDERFEASLRVALAFSIKNNLKYLIFIVESLQAANIAGVFERDAIFLSSWNRLKEMERMSSKYEFQFSLWFASKVNKVAPVEMILKAANKREFGLRGIEVEG